MRTTRLLFDDSETPESIARRIVRAFNPGEIFCVKGKFFLVSRIRTANEIPRINVVGDKYTLVLNLLDPGLVQDPVALTPIIELLSTTNQPLSEPPPSAVPQAKTLPKRLTSESGEYPIVRDSAAKVTREGPPKTQPEVGQDWQPKDQRRSSTSFTITKVDIDFVYTNRGGRISLKRWRNYRLVTTPNEVPRQSSG
jgi:hypothetical protein